MLHVSYHRISDFHELEYSEFHLKTSTILCKIISSYDFWVRLLYLSEQTCATAMVLHFTCTLVHRQLAKTEGHFFFKSWTAIFSLNSVKPHWNSSSSFDPSTFRMNCSTASQTRRAALYKLPHFLWELDFPNARWFFLHVLHFRRLWASSGFFDASHDPVTWKAFLHHRNALSLLSEWRPQTLPHL